MTALSHDAFAQGFCEDHFDELLHLAPMRMRGLETWAVPSAERLRVDKRLLGHLRGLVSRPEAAWRRLDAWVEQNGPGEVPMLVAGLLVGFDARAAWRDALAAWLDHCASPYALAREWQRWARHVAKDAVFQPPASDDAAIATQLRLAAAVTPEAADAAVASIPHVSPDSVLEAVARTVLAFGLPRFEPDLVALTRADAAPVREAAQAALLRIAPHRAAAAVDAPAWAHIDTPEWFLRAALALPGHRVESWVARLDADDRAREALWCAAASGCASLLGYVEGKTADPVLGPLAVLCRTALAGEAPGSARRESRADAATEHAPAPTHLLDGRPASVAHACALLRDGTQLQRVIAGYWLESRHPGYHADPCAPAFARPSPPRAPVTAWPASDTTRSR
jgi:hypothetical protein